MTRPHPDPQPITPFYEGSDLETTENLVNYNRWIIDTFTPFLRGHVVELGAGRGTISRLIEPSVDLLDLVEPSPNLNSVLAARFGPSPRVKVFGVSLEDHLREASPESYDAAVLVNVLEHIADDTGALSALRHVLKPGGHLLIFVPALAVLYSRFDRVVGHHRRYHLNVLLPEIRSAGFDIVSARYFDLFGTFPWLILNRILGATKLNPAMMSIYDKFITPVSRMFETAINPPFGKNIILVARRRMPQGASL